MPREGKSRRRKGSFPMSPKGNGNCFICSAVGPLGELCAGDCKVGDDLGGDDGQPYRNDLSQSQELVRYKAMMLPDEKSIIRAEWYHLAIVGEGMPPGPALEQTIKAEKLHEDYVCLLDPGGTHHLHLCQVAELTNQPFSVKNQAPPRPDNELKDGEVVMPANDEEDQDDENGSDNMNHAHTTSDNDAAAKNAGARKKKARREEKYNAAAAKNAGGARKKKSIRSTVMFEDKLYNSEAPVKADPENGSDNMNRAHTSGDDVTAAATTTSINGNAKPGQADCDVADEKVSAKTEPQQDSSAENKTSGSMTEQKQESDTKDFMKHLRKLIEPAKKRNLPFVLEEEDV